MENGEDNAFILKACASHFAKQEHVLDDKAPLRDK